MMVCRNRIGISMKRELLTGIGILFVASSVAFANMELSHADRPGVSRHQSHSCRQLAR